MSPEALTELIKSLATYSGFERCGICDPAPISRADYLREWLRVGRAGSMQYMHKYAEQREDPRELLPGARSIIVVARLYNQKSSPEQHTPAQPDVPRGRVAMYAWGQDYHDVMRARLYEMLDEMRERIDQPFGARVCVDTAPLLEREVAARAGIGWIGKNTLVLHERLGSYFFLGAILTTLTLAVDEPAEDHCGSCTACLSACPTAAFPKAYEMDASRCISYLTIEHRAEIDPAFHEAMGDWIFGCDICQEVCPFNRHAPDTTEAAFDIRPPAPNPPLEEIAGWSTEDYRRVLRGSAIRRAKLDMLKRNARIAADNARRKHA